MTPATPPTDRRRTSTRFTRGWAARWSYPFGGDVRRAAQLPFDREAVLFGAATHDVGKVRHPEELSGPGSAHEPAGYELLLKHGVAESSARFARDHASWHRDGIDVEDLLVSVADKVWKGKRVTDLEELLVDRLADVTGRERWSVFLDLDDILDRITADADLRLAFQATHPVRG
ncbi:HD domain-containing protein [Micromonospora parva]|uniref:HD domain-containing protein n=1 Tax=Micromonospora parva TaxID=1464048 RepID=UPI00340E0E81